MLKLSAYYGPRSGKALFMLTEPDGTDVYESDNLGLIFDWLDDNSHHQIWMHTGTRRMTVSINRRRD